ncbi:MAG: glycosyltransferase family 4 protein [Atribacterota bacterium]|nr:glycosyltransferase family 4 protein [Atribacterota bacterium]
MNVWLTQIGEPLPLNASIRKNRTAFLADKLVERGHKVTWWASSFDHGDKSMIFPKDQSIVINDSYTIFVIKGLGYRKNISLQRYLDHRIIAKKFHYKFRHQKEPDIIIASMPDHFTAYEAVKYANSRKIPILVDVRDEWPDIFLDYIPRAFRILARIFLFDDYRRLIFALKNADGLLSMMQDVLDWSLIKAKRKKIWKDKVFYIGASKPCIDSTVENSNKFSGLRNKVKNRFVVTFIGTFGEYYNPQIIIEAAKKINMYGLGDQYFFLIAGDGKYYATVKNSAAAMENVFCPGWVKEPEIAFLLSLSSVGIIPCTKTIYAFPNKAFTYLSAGVPLISSVNGELKNIIEKHEIGFTYKPNDTDELIKLIEKIRLNSDLQKDISKRANNLFIDQFEADKIYTDYVMHIEKYFQLLSSSKIFRTHK